MKHFVFFKAKNDAEASWGLALEDATLPEVRAHTNNRTIYKDPTEWTFKIIRGRELPAEFEVVVRI